jgi:predicted  nucleic acid-binding Zn-ribbon protein
MKMLMENLVRLQSLECDEPAKPGHAAQIAELRGQIPAPILGHYDRLRARGKKGVAAVRHQVCTGCHMSVPLATVLTLKHGTDVQLCDSCGRYLYLPPEEESAPAPPPPPPPRRGRKPKAAAKRT